MAQIRQQMRRLAPIGAYPDMGAFSQGPHEDAKSPLSGPGLL